MKILVFSDSHGQTRLMEKAIREHLKHGSLERVFFLGDGIHDIRAMELKVPSVSFDIVSGNCDGVIVSGMIEGDAPFEKSVTVGGIRFLLMHGHKYNMKSTIQAAADHALARKADILLYGHTHVREDITIDGSNGGHVRLINPGSVGASYGASFALLEIVGDDVVCGFGGT